MPFLIKMLSQIKNKHFDQPQMSSQKQKETMIPYRNHKQAIVSIKNKRSKNRKIL